MATYQVDFTSDTIGNPPSGWTNRYATDWVYTVESLATARGGKALKMVGSTTTRTYRLLSYNTLDGAADVESLYRLYTPAFALDEYSLYQCWARASGSAGSETAYRTNWYLSLYASIRKHTSGTLSNVRAATDIGTPTGWGFPTLQDRWLWLRFRVAGTSLKMKLWPCNGPEPIGWFVVGTNSDLSSGWHGLGWGNNSSNIGWCDYVGFGTGGDAAPFPASPTTDTQAVYQAFTEVALAHPLPTVKTSGVLLQVLVKNDVIGGSSYVITNANN